MYLYFAIITNNNNKKKYFFEVCYKSITLIYLVYVASTINLYLKLNAWKYFLVFSKITQMKLFLKAVLTNIKVTFKNDIRKFYRNRLGKWKIIFSDLY